jgi:CTP synthase (UTP-ammonia lyase)
MTRRVRIALIGDYTPSAKAHQGIPRALNLASKPGDLVCEWEWIHTSTLATDPSQQLKGFDALWCVPVSPYSNPAAALAAIRFARQTGRPFLGTCAGFQHAMLEYAAAVWGVAHPAHAELNPEADNPVISLLLCSLVEQSLEIRLEKGSRLASIYGTATATEGYHCRYGLSRAYGDRLSSGALRVSARDADGDVRAVELDGHPFFMATLFQPERSGLQDRRHPLIATLVAEAARQHS